MATSPSLNPESAFNVERPKVHRAGFFPRPRRALGLKRKSLMSRPNPLGDPPALPEDDYFHEGPSAEGHIKKSSGTRFMTVFWGRAGQPGYWLSILILVDME